MFWASTVDDDKDFFKAEKKRFVNNRKAITDQ
jgi:hypothetical protein